jgi:hypothetical protein
MDEELDLAGCSLRIKQDRRDGHTGTYLGFERRGRLNFSEEQTMPPSDGRPSGKDRDSSHGR